MTHRRRTLLITLALGFSAALAPATLVAAAPGQDGGATFGGTGTETSTTLAGATTAAPSTTAATSDTNQTLVESEEAPDQPLFTENRKVAAVIGALVFVALALLLLTVRYIRVTKPIPAGDISDIPMLPDAAVELDDDSVFVVDLDAKKEAVPAVPAVAPAATPAPSSPSTDAAPAAAATATALVATPPPATDHDAADADWEPRTDEHQRVEIPSGTTLARPGLAARRKALGVDPD